jgi:hypothetical protein
MLESSTFRQQNLTEDIYIYNRHVSIQLLAPTVAAAVHTSPVYK